MRACSVLTCTCSGECKGGGGDGRGGGGEGAGGGGEGRGGGGVGWGVDLDGHGTISHQSSRHQSSVIWLMVDS